MAYPTLKEIVADGNKATFSHYTHGNLYYSVQVGANTYQFPLVVFDENDFKAVNSVKYFRPSVDLGTTTFEREYKAITLMRWIRFAMEKGLFTRAAARKLDQDES